MQLDTTVRQSKAIDRLGMKREYSPSPGLPLESEL